MLLFLVDDFCGYIVCVDLSPGYVVQDLLSSACYRGCVDVDMSLLLQYC